MAIQAVRRGSLGRRYWGARRGALFALLPEPVASDAGLADAGFTELAPLDEAWERDFDELVGALLRALERRFGAPSVVAPGRAGSWMDRLRGIARLPSLEETINPGELSALAALSAAARGEVDFATVELGRSAEGLGDAMVFATDARPILWVWLAEGAETSWPMLAEEGFGPWPSTELSIAWEALLPKRPALATELPRASLHRGESASWRDGSRSLTLMAGLGVIPPEVYLPTDAGWSRSAPAWARTLRSAVVRDFEEIGARIVARDDAAVLDARREGVSPEDR